MDLLRFMEIATLVITVFMFFTGISPCLHMYKTGDTRNVPYTIFLLSAVSCAGMVHYGVMIGVGSLVFLNIIGTALNLAYTAVYILVIGKKTVPVAYFTMAVAYLMGIYAYMYAIIEAPETREAIIGTTSSSITTFIMVMPAVELVDNLKNKNADGIPAVMLWSGGACAISWLIYGLLLNDANIYAPNIPGLIITAAKLFVINLYGQVGKQKAA